MTRERAKALTPIRNAWIEGKTIQHRFTDIMTADWHDYLAFDHEPTWGGTAGPLEWRIKPQPKEVWVRVFEDGDLGQAFPINDHYALVEHAQMPDLMRRFKEAL